MLMDIKKIYHRDAERDEGWYEFDVTPAVQRWIARNPKNFQVSLPPLSTTSVVKFWAVSRLW
jgi:hypothetical protein